MYVISAHQRYRQTDGRWHDRSIALAWSGKNAKCKLFGIWKCQLATVWPITHAGPHAPPAAAAAAAAAAVGMGRYVGISILALRLYQLSKETVRLIFYFFLVTHCVIHVNDNDDEKCQ